MKSAYIKNDGEIVFIIQDKDSLTLSDTLKIKQYQNDIDNLLIFPVDFDGSSIPDGTEKVIQLEGVWTIVKDQGLDDDIEFKKTIEKELQKMNLGKNLLAYIGVKLNPYDLEDYQSLLANNEMMLIQILLGQGALESALSMLRSMVPNDLVTQQMKDDIILKLEEMILTIGGTIE